MSNTIPPCPPSMPILKVLLKHQLTPSRPRSFKSTDQPDHVRSHERQALGIAYAPLFSPRWLLLRVAFLTAAVALGGRPAHHHPTISPTHLQRLRSPQPAVRKRHWIYPTIPLPLASLAAAAAPHSDTTHTPRRELRLHSHCVALSALQWGGKAGPGQGLSQGII